MLKMKLKNTVLLVVLFGYIAQVSDITGSEKVKLVPTAKFARFELSSLVPCSTEQFTKQIGRKQKQIVKISFYDTYKNVSNLRPLLNNGKLPLLTSEDLAFLSRGEAIPCTNAACMDASCKPVSIAPVEVYCTVIASVTKKNKKRVTFKSESLL